MRKISTLTDTADNNDEFTNGNAAAGIKPTLLIAGWFNTIQRELAAIVEEEGETLDVNDDEQISKIIGKMSAVITHYRNYGYPEWENNVSYYAGAVVYYNGGLYLSLNNNNLANIPGNDDSIWQPYIQREATAPEALQGTGSTEVMTPRRVKAAASALDTALQTALTPYLLPVGAIVLWGAEALPNGWLECNGQTFDTKDNPKLASLYPAGVVPDYRDRYPRGRSSSSELAGTAREENWDHRHFAGQMNGDGGAAADDVFLPYVSGKTSLVDIGETMMSRGVFGDGKTSSFGWGSFPISGKGYMLFTGKKPLDLDGDNATLHPADIAAIYIIKTDQAESSAGTTTPSAIVISPETVTVNAGTTQLFTGIILPSDLADDYTISWSVSDNSLGSITDNGLYAATAGKNGTQTIIASLSTGLTATAAVTQQVYLTAISFGTLPDELLAGNSYTIPITFAPAMYTENVIASSSDSSVATLASDGTLTINGAGTCTVSLTGANSGVTASITITATEQEVPEVYLQIANNLSEINELGATAMVKARANLGLGGLATKDTLTAVAVGAVPQDSTTLGADDLNTAVSPGRKFQSLTINATTATHYPVALAGMLDVIKTTDTGGIRQIYYPVSTTDVYHRYCENTAASQPVWSDWSNNGGSFLVTENNLSDVTDVAKSRENLGVSYTVSTDAAPADASGYADGHVWYQVEASN